jgi:hypothetical protein
MDSRSNAAASGSVLSEQHGRQRLAHVPFDIVSEHAQEHVRADPIGRLVKDRSDLEVDCLGTAERPLDIRKLFV